MSSLPQRFSFRDISILKTVKSLTKSGVSPRRVCRQLAALRSRLPDTSIAELSVAAFAGNVVVRDSSGDFARAWRADTGQLLFDFGDPAATAGEITQLPVCRTAVAPGPVPQLTADEWFDRAVALEESDPDSAIAAYKRALRLNPECTETLTNLGRLYAESGQLDQATDAFREALALDPSDATAFYNLGVVAQDAGNDELAIDHYKKALSLDPSISEAHYNLATIFDRCGDPRAAIRHIHEYRKLTKRR